MTEIETRVSGIPCIARVTHYMNQPGSYSRNAASDMDYYGYTECEFEICDRRGRPAPWLEKKMTTNDSDRITTEIAKHMEH